MQRNSFKRRSAGTGPNGNWAFNQGRARMQIARTFSSLSIAIGLFALSALPGLVGSAAAQQQEKRIAFVVGNAAYAKVPLATTANDAGLVAQQLQAAGFDVIGARDLDGYTLRKSFHDFVEKAQADPANTVAMVY